MDNNSNYQMFFPPFSPPTIMPTTNHQVYNYTSNFHESSNGLLNNNSTVVQRSSSSELVKEEHDVSQSSGDAFSRNDDDLIGKSSGKKKEKKVKKPRCAFQTRSRVDILDDGYRWRKYGQKAVKNNKFPRSYYRCTHQGCNVKKQVQRLTKDETIVVTTYEGMHNHPIEKPSDNFEQILSQMQICPSF